MLGVSFLLFFSFIPPLFAALHSAGKRCESGNHESVPYIVYLASSHHQHILFQLIPPPFLSLAPSNDCISAPRGCHRLLRLRLLRVSSVSHLDNAAQPHVHIYNPARSTRPPRLLIHSADYPQKTLTEQRLVSATKSSNKRFIQLLMSLLTPSTFDNNHRWQNRTPVVLKKNTQISDTSLYINYD